MKKIIAAFDGLKYSESTRDYAIFLAKQTNAHLVAVFLDDPAYTSYKIYELINEKGPTEEKFKKFETKDKNTRMAASGDFEKTCQQEKIEFTVHHDHNIAIHELKHESIYADLLVIDAKETLTHYEEKPPTRFIRDLLGDAQCPVLIVPAKFKPLNKIVLLYDGQPSSVYAIKMFDYLLPQLKHMEIEVVSVNPYFSSTHLADKKLFREYMKRHYPTAGFSVLKGFAEDEIVKHLKQSGPNTLVVLGAYRRGTVSRWFRESMADVLMKGVKLPLFIAHYK
jgi:Universal stress protein family